MPHPPHTQVVDADEFLDPSTEPDDANEESGALQDALLDGDEDDGVEIGMYLEHPSYKDSNLPVSPPFRCGHPQWCFTISTFLCLTHVRFSLSTPVSSVSTQAICNPIAFEVQRYIHMSLMIAPDLQSHVPYRTSHRRPIIASHGSFSNTKGGATTPSQTVPDDVGLCMRGTLMYGHRLGNFPEL